MRKRKLFSKFKKEIKNEEVFLHPSFSSLLDRENKQIFDTWMVPIKELSIRRMNPGTIGFTDNNTITLNACAKPFDDEVDQMVAFRRFYGVDFHEIGHILFTSFTAMRSYQSSIEHGNLYPSIPDVLPEYESNLEELKEYIQDQDKARKLNTLLHLVANAIEDARIEHMLMSYCPNATKFKAGLLAMQDYMAETLPTLSELNEQGSPDAVILCQLILNYARLGEPSRNEVLDDPNYNLIIEASDFIDAAIDAKKSDDFYDCINHILMILWQPIKEYLNQKNDSEDVQDDLSNMEGETMSHEEEESESSNEGSDSESISRRIESIEESKSERSSNEEEIDLSGDSDLSFPHSDVPYRDPDEDYNGNGKGRTYATEDLNPSPFDLDAVLNRIANEKLDAEDEVLSHDELSEKATSMPRTDLNKNASVRIVRPKVNGKAKSLYHSKEIQKVVSIGELVARRIKKVLPTEKEPVVLHNRVIGSKFEASSVAKHDLRYFSKTSKPEEQPSLAIGLVVDESGSMLGDRELSARAAAIALHACATKLNVPICIYGHTADIEDYDVSLYHYTDWLNPTSDDKYRIMNIKARGNNRDGLPVQFVAERLLSSDCEQKLLIIISDGQPQAYGYSGVSADNDLKNIVRTYSKKGINIIAAAIGSDKENIRRIYGEKRFLDISDLTELPSRLLRIVKKHLI